MYYILIILFIILFGTCTFASEVTLVNRAGQHISFSDLKTPFILLTFDDKSILEIPLTSIAEIQTLKVKEPPSPSRGSATITVKTTDGHILRGTSDSAIEGVSSVGASSIGLWDIKSAIFRTSKQTKNPLFTCEDNYHVLLTTDVWSDIDICNFAFNFTYVKHHHATNNDSRRSMVKRDDNPRRYLPFVYKNFRIQVPFHDIVTISITPHDTSQSFASLRKSTKLYWTTRQSPSNYAIQMHNGRVIHGKIDMLRIDSVFKGHTIYGKFLIPSDKVKMIKLKGYKSHRPVSIRDAENTVQSGIQMTVNTIQGETVVVQDGCVLEDIADENTWEKVTTILKAEYKGENVESDLTIIKQIDQIEIEKDRFAATLLTHKGEEKAIFMSLYTKLCGTIERLGPGFIPMADIAAVSFAKQGG